MTARHRQASKRWRHRRNGRPDPSPRTAYYHWAAMDAATFVLCPHLHHSRQSAGRCGAHLFETYRVVRVTRNAWGERQ